ncbi:MAG: DUF1302 family protein [Nitrospira sp.]|nr:hypothetical protein [Candidatus Manganitrophaceae bacterium]HIL35235.1 hypothetical protein [Candidatus Manganitrophaceae bacterium]
MLFAPFRIKQTRGSSHGRPCGLRVVRSAIVLAFLLHAGLAWAQIDVEDIFPSILAPERKKAPSEVKKEALPEEKAPKAPPSVLDRALKRISHDLTWGGYLRNETAFRIVDPTGFDKILNIIQLEGRYRLTPRVSLSGRFWAFYDAAYDVESISTVSPRKGSTVPCPEEVNPNNLDLDNPCNIEIVDHRTKFKELYLDINMENFDLRIGRQIVRWGVVEGSRVTDEVNPLDFYELILRDIDDRYIPLFMVKGDLYLGANSFEAIWIPEVRGHRPAPRGSEWEQFQLLPGHIKPRHAFQDITDLDQFKEDIDNGEYALKYTRVFTGHEISFSYFYTWDDFPASFRSIQEATIFGGEVAVDFQPRHNRLTILGTTFSKTFPSFVLNAEAVYVDGKMFGTRLQNQPSAEFGEKQRDFVKGAIGFDAYVLGVDISPAIILQYIFYHDEAIIQDRLDTVIALFLRKEFVHNVWSGNLLLLRFENDNDWLIRPRTNYNVTDRVRLSFGLDLFEGKIGSGQPGEFNFIGFFDNNDRLFWDITYSF